MSEVAYGAEDRPPFGLQFALAAQLAFGVVLPLVYPVVVFRGGGMPLAEIPAVLSWGLFALAAAVLLQARRPPVGIGHLLPSLNSALYLHPASIAFGVGGRSLVAGMTVLAGVSEVALSRLVTRWRRFFPPVVTGLVVFLVGAEVGLEAVRLGVEAVRASEASNVVEGSISAATFLIIVGGVVWGNLWIRNMAPVIGVAVGAALSLLLIDLPAADQAFVAATSIVAMPEAPGIAFSFDARLLVPFLVLGLAAALRTVGVVMTLHDASHPGERGTDHAEVGRGVRNDGIGATLSGLVGMPGISSSPSSVGVQIAAGNMARRVAVPLAALLVAAAFFPRVLAYLVTAPAAVVSALLTYYASFMMVAGLKLIGRQRLDTRVAFTIGGSISLALGARTYGSANGVGADWVGLISTSMVTVGILTAIGLTVVFRAGARRRRAVVLRTAEGGSGIDPSEVLVSTLGELDVASSPEAVPDYVSEVLDEIDQRSLADGEVRAEISTDDLQLRIVVTYEGRPLDIQPARPLDRDDLTDENVFAAGLARYLDAPRPDDLTVRTRGDEVELVLVYELV